MTEPTQSNCTHHWMISRPHGDWVEGICRDCGAMMAFPSTVSRIYPNASWRPPPAAEKTRPVGVPRADSQS
jgi:hypothetical protein